MTDRLPPYLRKALTRHYGAQLDRILAGYEAGRKVTLRINPLLGAREEVLDALRGREIRWEPVSWYPDALILPDACERELEELPVYQDGKIYLQNLSAMIPALLVRASEGQAVLDLCAAPGGKSTQLAALHGDRIDLTLCERDAVRAERLRFNVKRQGVRRAVVMQTDGRQLDPLFRFDAVLLDAPCTGSGTIRFDEPPRRMEPAWVQKTVRTQKALLRKAWEVLKPGGSLVYSTCSILPEENEEAARTLLSQGAELVPVPPEICSAVPQLPCSLPGALCVCPDEIHEGFFVCAMRKPK